MKLARTNQLLTDLLGRAEIKETLSPGSAIRLLQSEKELSRLAYLAGQLCALRRRSCKAAVKVASMKNVPLKKRKEPITYGLNVDATKTSLRAGACPRSFSVLCETGYKEGALRSR